MILDMQSMFSWKQAITSTGYSTDVTNAGCGFQGNGYMDLGPTDAFALSTMLTEKLGLGGGFSNDIYLVALVTTQMNDHPTTPVATVVVTLETADDASFTSNLPTLMTLGTFAAHSAAGSRLAGGLPPLAEFRRYLRVKYTVSGGPLSAGKFSAFFVNTLNANKGGYPDRLSIA